MHIYIYIYVSKKEKERETYGEMVQMVIVSGRRYVSINACGESSSARRG